MNLAVPLMPVNVTTTEGPSALSAEALCGEGRRHGAEDRAARSHGTVLMEAPWHTHAINYLALGMSQRDTARACERSEQQIAKLLRAPWFCERLSRKMAEGHSDIMALFKGASLDAYATLVEINNDKDAPKSVRVSAAKELLDRHLGKAMQHVKVEPSGACADPVAEVEFLEAELTRLNKPATERAST